MNFLTGQQVLSVADFESTIEMPLGQSFSSPSSFFSDYRTHWFSRSEDYSVFKVSFPAIVDTSGAPFQRLVSMELSASDDSPIAWETTFIMGGAFYWAAGLATVTAADLDFGFGGGGVPVLTEEQKLRVLLAGIGRHLATEEPEAARQTWVGLNPFSLVSHQDWRWIAGQIEQELPDLAQGKESNILKRDGTFTLPTRSNLSDFVQPEPAAVPEPATLALLGLGIAGLALSRRRVARPRCRTSCVAAA